MDKITKFLLKLTNKERDTVLGLLEKIRTNNWVTLDYSTIQGQKDMYRVRKGAIRIVFIAKGIDTKVINIDYRGQVYKGL